MANVPRIFQLSGTCNNYPWGKKGRESLAAQFYERTPGTGFTIDADQHYLELWFGDYPDFPGKVLKSGELLAKTLQANQKALLGNYVVNHLDAQLPFLPKVGSLSYPARRDELGLGATCSILVTRTSLTRLNRSCQSQRHCRSRSILTRNSRSSCTGRNQINTPTQTTSLK